jgi:hypothetical protein
LHANTPTANVSVAAGGRYNWRVSIPEDIVRQEQNFTFKFVNAQDPPNYIKAGGAYVVSPSRGFKVALAANAASASSSRTAPASSSTASPTSSPTATSTQIPANNDNNNNKKKKSSKTPIGAIVGGVLGGLAILALAVIAWLLWKRSQKKAAAAQAAVSQEPYGIASHGPYGNAPPYVPEMANTETSMHSTAPTTKYAQTAGAPHELPANHAPVEADGGFRGYR